MTTEKPMRNTEEKGKIENFFGSGVVKEVFDNIKSLLTSATLLIAGFYITRQVSPKAEWKMASTFLGWCLIITGGALFLLCALDGSYKLGKALKSPIKKWPLAILYLFIATLMLITTLHLNGIIFK